MEKQIEILKSQKLFYKSYTLKIPYNEKLEHRRPLCIERERDPLQILLVAMRCYAHYIMRAVSLSVIQHGIDLFDGIYSKY